MLLLSVQNIRKHYGPEPVLDGASFELYAGDRVAIVGPNGAGKTTLINIIAGREDSDAGQIELPRNTRLGVLEQQPDFDSAHTLWEEARSALADLIDLARQAEVMAEAISAAVSVAERDRLSGRYDDLQQELHRRDAYELDHKVERVLDGLGFPTSAYLQPVHQLSGGQQNRLLLAKLLLAEPDLLLLDEPSNHLDIEATEWLEGFLVESRQSIILISHDRYLLDRIANRTLELCYGTIDSYVGNFTAYLKQKAERLEVQRRTYEKQQLEIAKLQEFVRKHHHGQKHAQAEDRRKKLERIEPVDPPREIAAPPMGFPQVDRSGDIVMRIEGLAKAFDQPLFSDLKFDILRGERWGILGPNGSGKTTLLRCLLGEQQADAGRVVVGSGVKIGYFDQLLGCLDSDALVVDAIRPSHKDFVEQQRRDLLARFGVVGDMVFQTVSSLSGGEQNRAALSMLAASDANLLVLDEPTNHLDLWARAALEKSLKKFAGTVLFVSHDRYFLNQVADHLLVIQNGNARPIDGNYDTFLNLVKAGLADAVGSLSRPAISREQPVAHAEGVNNNRRRRKFPYRKVQEIEADISGCEDRIAEIHQLLTSPGVLRDGEQVKQLKEELDERQDRLEELMEHWEEASELN